MEALGKLRQLQRSRPILIDQCVKVSFHAADISQAFKNMRPHVTPILANVCIDGAKGRSLFPFHYGLTAQMLPGKAEGEQLLQLGIDEKLFKTLNPHKRRFLKSMLGTTSSHISQFICGVTEGHSISIRLSGIGYKAALNSNGVLNLKLGHSHEICMPVPNNVKVQLPTPAKIILSGHELCALTAFAASIRAHRKPEPYSGKGVYVSEETIQRKEGKKNK